MLRWRVRGGILLALFSYGCHTDDLGINNGNVAVLRWIQYVSNDGSDGWDEENEVDGV